MLSQNGAETSHSDPLQLRNIPRPRVLQYYPRGGMEGMPFTVVLQFCPKEQLKLGFGTHVVNTKQWNAHGYTTLTASIPEFAETKWFTPKVPVCILAVEQGIVLDSWYFGEYKYNNDELLNPNASMNDNFSTGGMYLNEPSQMNNTLQSSIDSFQNSIESMVTNGFQNSMTSMMTNVAPNNITESIQTTMSNTKSRESELTPLSEEQEFKFTFGTEGMCIKNPNLNLAQANGFQSDLSESNNESSLFTPQSSQRDLESYTQETGGNNVSSVDITPPLTPVTAQASQTCPKSPLPQNPQPSPKNGTAAAPAPNDSSTTPLNKATLKFSNEFEEMTKNWTEEETEIKRRLVQFWRKHENNVIHCDFQGVSPSERAPNSIVVSCIYWEAKDDYFITSVDCIYLLESLIAVRFTVEEKNRIRRNLEGFRPLTVSKCKSESADFFKLIMSFPNPKPRNIEKDVKVFPWKILPLALKKIIGKYTSNCNNSTNVNVDAFHNTFAPNYAAEAKGSIGNQSPSPGPESTPALQKPEVTTTDSPSVSPDLSQGLYVSQAPLNDQPTGPQRRQHSFLQRHSLVGPYSVPSSYSHESPGNMEQTHNHMTTQIPLQSSIDPSVAMVTFNDDEVKEEPSFEDVLNESFNTEVSYPMPSYQESTWMFAGNGAINIPHTTSFNGNSGVNMNNGFASLYHPSFMMSNSRI
ncbi:hypothetical protein K493DRAFT_299273 [Basidiobolus meristosporus CBS 931.73]|uniref:DUF7082 domain-containing protein n=1 Tax=Basidiobolus meristosporus CBS 931.73 TaxID=1314790 RepID=A0A1Y1YP96_9FUNG|nr:hypothetical protein K493DRAFT_299273 [Basidiobolus meristosporus CBS 931.73]|eukprot:ORX99653.1 hypothetical protein K493DRAFT_299273 [Basidiobolus meristosporus CBS 931.73]